MEAAWFVYQSQIIGKLKIDNQMASRARFLKSKQPALTDLLFVYNMNVIVRWRISATCEKKKMLFVFLTLNMSGNLGSFAERFRKLEKRNSKTANCRAKRAKIWASGVYVACFLYF